VQPAPAAAPVQPIPAAAPGGALGSAQKFPPVPRELGGAFFRGADPNRPDLIGFYFHSAKLAYLLAIVLLWHWTAAWIDQDARGLRLPQTLWNSVVLLAGVAGAFLALGAPNFLFAWIVSTSAYAVPCGVYVFERNKRVPDSGKVLTPRHLRSVGLRLLARVGIRLATKEFKAASGGPPIRFLGKSAKGVGEVDRSRQVESSKGYSAAKELVYDAILRRATDIHLEPKEDELSVRLRIDGVMYPAEPFDRPTGDAIINIFKVLAAMDITERRKPQDGSFRAEAEGREIDFRVASQGTQVGEKLSLRILDQGAGIRTLADLGLRKNLLEQVLQITHQPHGMFLSCGPTGAGKSTTLYAALGEIDAYENNIITIEDPIEYRMNNVTQIEINTKAGQTFGGSLRSVLRQDPDIVMIGEIRDSETAKIACQAATTGHMVFSTVHANDTITALFRLIDLGVEPFLLASSISAILGQRLVRKLCDDCKESYSPSADLLQKIGLPADKVDKFYRPPKQFGGACPTCGGLGYVGRTGVFELLVVNDRIRDLIRENPNMSQIRAEARKAGMLYMREEGLRLVVKGVTSIDELMRVVK
jgi:type II secretory ATPase GspE/PulE/Tfp pilus assembly ATPase PilB-like protein